MKIRAIFIGMQYSQRFGAFPLYNLIDPLPGHPVGSTVSLNTLRLHGAEPIEPESRSHLYLKREPG